VPAIRDRLETLRRVGLGLLLKQAKTGQCAIHYVLGAGVHIDGELARKCLNREGERACLRCINDPPDDRILTVFGQCFFRMPSRSK
jgi:hypothetical protein